MMDKKERRGRGHRWSSEHGTGFGSRVINGFTVDNLDSKNIPDAENNYEKVFILIRKALEANSACCMDVLEERLQCCQVIADKLKESLLIRG